MYDENNNAIEVPEGFKVKNPAEDETIIYDYLEDKTPAVQDGIVIEDDLGNQFVWIPVGEINNKKESEVKTTKITLGRYTFGEDGTPSTAYKGSDIIKSGIYSCIEENEEEHKSSKYGNNIAKDIEGFKKSAEINHGYYIARYEAVKDSSGKLISKQGAVWNSNTQITASTSAKTMYTSEKFASDLINSFAWDTAVLFIQNCSENKKYSQEHPKNTSVSSTGERGETTDKICNIYDMASSCYEWTTETSIGTSGYPCVIRGGAFYRQSETYTSYRDDDTANGAYSGVSFRAILYIL